jgi:hypothetical protein
MTREEFIELLDLVRCRYILDGEKITINEDNSGVIRFPYESSIPNGVIFANGGYLTLKGVVSISPEVEFNNSGELIISPILSYGNGYLKHQEFHIDEIGKKRLFNHMISKGLFQK